MATKPIKTAVETVQDAAQETVAKMQETTAKMQDAFTSFSEKFEVPAAAREFVQRSATTAKEKLADAHAGANNATVSYEKAVSTLVNANAAAMRSMLQAAYDNSLATIAAVEKLVGAKSIQEAYQIQNDFAREYASANWARVQSAAETVKANVEGGVKMFQDETAKVVSFVKKAA